MFITYPVFACRIAASTLVSKVLAVAIHVPVFAAVITTSVIRSESTCDLSLIRQLMLHSDPRKAGRYDSFEAESWLF